MNSVAHTRIKTDGDTNGITDSSMHSHSLISALNKMRYIGILAFCNMPTEIFKKEGKKCAFMQL